MYVLEICAFCRDLMLTWPALRCRIVVSCRVYRKMLARYDTCPAAYCATFIACVSLRDTGHADTDVDMNSLRMAGRYIGTKLRKDDLPAAEPPTPVSEKRCPAPIHFFLFWLRKPPSERGSTDVPRRESEDVVPPITTYAVLTHNSWGYSTVDPMAQSLTSLIFPLVAQVTVDRLARPQRAPRQQAGATRMLRQLALDVRAHFALRIARQLARRPCVRPAPPARPPSGRPVPVHSTCTCNPHHTGPRPGERRSEECVR